MNPNRPEAGKNMNDELIDACAHDYVRPDRVCTECGQTIAAAPSPAQTDEQGTFEADYAKVWNAAMKENGWNGDHTADDVKALREGNTYGEGRDYLNARWEGWQARAALQAAPAAENVIKTGDRLTDEKANHIIARDGFKQTGVVLSKPDGSRCIVELSAVRWLTNDEMWAIMHPVQSAADAPGMAELVAWESTTPVYRRFITDTRYQKLSQQARKWYKPYRCPHCSTDAPQPSPTAVARDDERAAFEVWWVRDVPAEYREMSINLLRKSLNEGPSYLKGAWHGWQARAEKGDQQ